MTLTQVIRYWKVLLGEQFPAIAGNCNAITIVVDPETHDVVISSGVGVSRVCCYNDIMPTRVVRLTSQLLVDLESAIINNLKKNIKGYQHDPLLNLSILSPFSRKTFLAELPTLSVLNDLELIEDATNNDVYYVDEIPLKLQYGHLFRVP